MITLRPAAQRGHADHGWLDAWHSFSFAAYFDPDNMGCGHLRVLNQDRIAPGKGFGTHGHQDMEIVTYVLEGTLMHRDSMGHEGPIHAGDVQFMSAGSGVRHSEFNGSDTDECRLLQIWIEPAESGRAPRYAQRHVGTAPEGRGFELVVAPDAQGDALSIGQDARISIVRLGAGESAETTISAGRKAYLHIAQGELSVGDQGLTAGDAAVIEDETEIAVRAEVPTIALLFDLA
jgi:redox-sensitive bicupin YhaK (pirin superfamily)